jgi:hypothetical protein
MAAFFVSEWGAHLSYHDTQQRGVSRPQCRGTSRGRRLACLTRSKLVVHRTTLITRMKAFKQKILLGSLIAVCLVFLPLRSIAQCTGVSKEPIFSGGDQNPITWSSLRNVFEQVVSYERKTENHSNHDGTDVTGQWPVIRKTCCLPILHFVINSW